MLNSERFEYAESYTSPDGGVVRYAGATLYRSHDRSFWASFEDAGLRWVIDDFGYMVFAGLHTEDISEDPQINLAFRKQSVCMHCNQSIYRFYGSLWHDESPVFPQYCKWVETAHEPEFS